MSMVAIKSAVIDAMNEIPEIGQVDGRFGRITSIPWDDAANNEIRPLWIVTLGRGERSRSIPPAISQEVLEYTWHIRGVMLYNFEQNSDGTWMNYLQAIMDKFAGAKSIATCSQTFRPRIVENSFIAYGASGEVLCHYAYIEFVTQEWVNT